MMAEREAKPSRGLLLINLGTPDAPEPEAVGRYLREFLMDPRVVDIPWPLRWFLVNAMIVPKRKYESAKAYRTIWTERGSPLLYHLQDLREAVAPLMPSDWKVEIGMRYGNPSIKSGLEKLAAAGVHEIIAFPLYPQFAESSSLSSVDETLRAARAMSLEAPIKFVRRHYNHPGYIQSFAARMRPYLERERPDHVLMSFHGLPERHIKRTDREPNGRRCLVDKSCCDQIVEANRDCYRAQSYATARALAQTLGLGADRYSVSFQSRLGRSPWIRPFTDEVIPLLAKRGVRKLAVVCPSFVADCLETIEEIGGRGAEQFKAAGGMSFVAIPCLNSDRQWAEAVASMARDAAAR